MPKFSIRKPDEFSLQISCDQLITVGKCFFPDFEKSCYGYVGAVLPSILLNQHERINLILYYIQMFAIYIGYVKHQHLGKIDIMEIIENRDYGFTDGRDDSATVAEIPEFIRAIYFHNFPERFPEVFAPNKAPPQYNLTASLPHTLPPELKEKLPKNNGQAYIPKSIPKANAFNYEMLQDFFHCIQRAAVTSNLQATMSLSSLTHTMLVSYKVDSCEWLHVDILGPSITQHSSLGEFSDKVLRFFSSYHHAVISYEFFAIEQRHIDELLASLNEDPKWQKLQNMTTKKLVFRGHYGESLAHLAAQMGDVKTLELVRDVKPKLLVEDVEYARSPLHAAIETEQTVTAQYLLQHGVAAIAVFFQALQEKEIPLVRFLLKNGVSPNSTNSAGKTALQVAFEMNDNTEILVALLKANAEISAEFLNSLTKRRRMQFERIHKRLLDSQSITPMPITGLHTYSVFSNKRIASTANDVSCSLKKQRQEIR